MQYTIEGTWNLLKLNLCWDKKKNYPNKFTSNRILYSIGHSKINFETNFKKFYLILALTSRISLNFKSFSHPKYI